MEVGWCELIYYGIHHRLTEVSQLETTTWDLFQGKDKVQEIYVDTKPKVTGSNFSPLGRVFHSKLRKPLSSPYVAPEG